ncbi:adenine deaminase [Pseudalkalibacillus salsuginis]|uniref:adenine deaminase n=1 Tax=Pseudalkalibacillus salsuginis TaxID=2910972 RepID=UPI001F456349|nr:adenine deaminase [Pseudalkalibacillus salsuginis]MCF6411345.1 adenine deaminase [Pseudalkalibacillus salsuginis]
MNPDKMQLKKRIAVASRQIPADIVIKNARIIDVFNIEIIAGDIAIADGIFVGIGEFNGTQVIDAENRFICPSFIDGHVHIESSMVTPAEFAKVVLPHGITTVITDPHEIANVSGKEGINFMLDNSENLELDVFIMLPSSVPATSVENSGAKLSASDLEPFYHHKRVLGLAEVMDFPSLRSADDELVDKIAMTSNYSPNMDGHLAGLGTDAINIYKAAGVQTDHECNTVEDALERLKRGMYLLIREGSVAKDLKSLISVVNQNNARRCLFCSDDKHLDDLIQEGSIDHNVRLAIQSGLDPLIAVQMASLNAAECYGLKQKGAIAPGYEADFLLMDDLDSIDIKEVYKSGKLIAREGEYVGKLVKKKNPGQKLLNTVNVSGINKKDLQITIGKSGLANIIGIIPNQLTTNHLQEQVVVENGVFVPSREKDQQKLVVVERHKHTGNVGLGIVKGFALENGAIATTIAHDSHNIVATGTNDEDLLLAIQTLKEINGGLVIIKNGKVLVSLALPIAGLMSDQGFHSIATGLHQVKQGLLDLGFKSGFNPFLTLSFLTLPVIPALKLTDLGLFDVKTFQHIEVSL